MFYFLGKTLVSKLFQERLKALGISRETLQDWARKHGFFPYEYLELWGAVWGWRVPRERFLVRLSLQMGMDPHHVLLSACADRVPAPYKSLFVEIQKGLEWCPAVVQAWQALDEETQQALLDLVSQPQQVRCWMKKYRLAQAHPHGEQSPGQRRADQGRLGGRPGRQRVSPFLRKPTLIMETEMNQTAAPDGEAQQGIRRYRKKTLLGGGLLLLAWAWATLVKPEYDDRSMAARSPVVPHPQAFDGAVLKRVHIRLMEYDETTLQPAAPDPSDPSLAPQANALLARDPGNLLEPRHRDLSVAVQGLSVGGKKAPAKRYEVARADATGTQADREVQTIVAGMNRDFVRY